MRNGQNTRRERYARDGFYLFEDVLDPLMLDRLRRFSDDVLAGQAPEHFEENRTTGSMVLIDWAMACRHPVMAELIAHPDALAALKPSGSTSRSLDTGASSANRRTVHPCSGTKMAASGMIR